MAVVVEENSANSVLVLAPTDELLTADVVCVIQSRIDSVTTKYVVLDFRAIRFLVSGSLYPHAEPLKPLLNINQQLQHKGRKLLLCNLSSEFANMFRVTRLEKLFEIQPDMDTVLSSIDGEDE